MNGPTVRRRAFFCVEGLVEGSVRPAVNAALVTTSMPKYFILTNQELTGAVEVRNLGTETITGVDLDIECGGAEKKRSTVMPTYLTAHRQSFR